MATYTGSSANETIIGTSNADTIYGNGGNDNLNGGAGNDTIYGGNGNDTIYGGDGDDLLVGDTIIPDPFNSGSNIMYGGIGNDTFYGGLLGDTMYGEGNDDNFIVQGTSSRARYDGGTGIDTITITDFNGYNPAGVSYVNLAIASIKDIEQIFNTSGRECYTIATNLDLRNLSLVNITGMRGDSDDNILYGEKVLDSATQTYRGIKMQGDAGNDTLFGSTLNDTIYGDAGNDTVVGGNGVDQLFGGAGQDLLAGQGGNDQLTGGTEADQFYFNLNGGQDTVVDFQNGIDKFVLGPDVKNVNVFSSNGSAALDLFNAATSTPHTYVLLAGISTSQIDGSDFIFA